MEALSRIRKLGSGEIVNKDIPENDVAFGHLVKVKKIQD
jgi:hypothetical protein